MLSGCAKKDITAKRSQNCDPKAECCSDADCAKNTSSNNTGMAYYPPCYEGKCENPKNSKEWIKYCGAAGKNARNLYTWNCYMNAAYDEIKKTSPSNNYTIDWGDAFKICEKYIPDDSERCKLDICMNLHFGDGNIKHNYPEEENCKKEAIKYSSCNDNKKNGRETDIDCGGPDCGPCKIKNYCEEHSDCPSGVCGGAHGMKKCYPICPNGLISDNEPCGCFQETTPQGEIRQTPIPNDHYNGSTKRWEEKYGNGKNVYCCDGVEYYFLPNNDCSTI